MEEVIKSVKVVCSDDKRCRLEIPTEVIPRLKIRGGMKAKVILNESTRRLIYQL